MVGVVAHLSTMAAEEEEGEAAPSFPESLTCCVTFETVKFYNRTASRGHMFPSRGTHLGIFFSLYWWGLGWVGFTALQSSDRWCGGRIQGLKRNRSAVAEPDASVSLVFLCVQCKRDVKPGPQQGYCKASLSHKRSLTLSYSACSIFHKTWLCFLRRNSFSKRHTLSWFLSRVALSAATQSSRQVGSQKKGSKKRGRY